MHRPSPITWKTLNLSALAFRLAMTGPVFTFLPVTGVPMEIFWASGSPASGAGALAASFATDPNLARLATAKTETAWANLDPTRVGADLSPLSASSAPVAAHVVSLIFSPSPSPPPPSRLLSPSRRRVDKALFLCPTSVRCSSSSFFFFFSDRRCRPRARSGQGGARQPARQPRLVAEERNRGIEWGTEGGSRALGGGIRRRPGSHLQVPRGLRAGDVLGPRTTGRPYPLLQVGRTTT